ncbi:MAG: Tab2 family RNA-binding protein [Geitlerinemataceae cyanobacterium]
MAESTYWQIDFYKRPVCDASGTPLWELCVVAPEKDFQTSAWCVQSEASADWIAARLRDIGSLPDALHAFRPEALSLIKSAGRGLGVTTIATRRTIALKRYLQRRAGEYRNIDGFSAEIARATDPLAVGRPAPTPLDESLQGDRWRFASLTPRDLDSLLDRPIRFKFAPDFLQPLNLNLASTHQIPGVVIDAGRTAIHLSRWLDRQSPVALDYIPGQPDGLVLELGLADRSIVATFEDPQMSGAGRTYRDRREAARGLHFLLVRPDDSDMTYTGLWLLQPA